jgi:tetratricopeptide (TPR) repeat protein
VLAQMPLAGTLLHDEAGPRKEVEEMKRRSKSLGLVLLVLWLPSCSKQADTAKIASDLRRKASDASGRSDFDASIKFASEALKLEPDNVDALWMRGLARLKIKDYAKAEEDLTQAIKLDANYAPAYRERGSVFLAQGNYAAAVQDATAFLRLRPADEDGLRIRILAHDKSGNGAAAAADLRELEKVKAKR